MNPLAQAQEEREKRLDSLEVENARLKERIRLMEEGEALELTQRAAASVDMNTTKELESKSFLLTCNSKPSPSISSFLFHHPFSWVSCLHGTSVSLFETAIFTSV